MASSLTFALQALLARHEAYVEEAERERLELNARIDRLEVDKQELAAENASKVEENRSLLEQLEALNNILSDSDAETKSLESSFLSSQQAVRCLEAAARRAADAERHLAILEDEQEPFHVDLRGSKEYGRYYAQHFKLARRGIMDMQDQVERIEKEGSQKRGVPLQGAGATRSVQVHRNGSKSVGHVVRALLQDNANLQLGIAELWELLMNSNDEIQSLINQLLHHRAMRDETSSRASTLRAELEPILGRPSLSQELHIHQLFPVNPKQDHRKSKEEREGLLPGICTTPLASAPSSPSNSGQWGSLAASPTAPALLCRVSEGKTTWDDSSQPVFEFSSIPSSPQIQHRVFDAGCNIFDTLNSPTTSFDPMSPTWRAAQFKRPSVSSTVSFQPLAMSLMDSVSDTPPAGPTSHSNCTETIDDEDKDGQSLPPLIQTLASGMEQSTPTEDSFADDSEYCRDVFMPRPRIQRVSSHESIISLTGRLDIYTLKSRPSRLTLRPAGGAVAIVTGVIACPTLSRSSAKRSNVALRDNFAGFQTPRAASNPILSRLSSSPASSYGASGKSSKWGVWRPWGGGSSPSPSISGAG